LAGCYRTYLQHGEAGVRELPVANLLQNVHEEFVALAVHDGELDGRRNTCAPRGGEEREVGVATAASHGRQLKGEGGHCVRAGVDSGAAAGAAPTGEGG
jgi:hypothetical protein